ncbi:MAG: GNAT family N-acetyltransferase [Phycisphaerae bacterium]|nr:GNAT family N-acetyltransferase [Phycisphaerae bacterium]
MTPAPTFRLRPFDAGRDEAAVRRILALSFAGTTEGVGAYLDLVGRSEMRVLDEGTASAAACLARIPMGQFFGGSSVPMVGIAGVGVAPEARGGGRAIALMQTCLRELAEERVPLSCLYASTQALYRQVGFEQAGSKFEYRIPLRQLTEGTRDLPIESLDAPDDRVRACYDSFARRYDGMLDRGPFIWSRVKQFRETTNTGFGVAPAGVGTALEGHVYFHQSRRDDGRHDVVISDIAHSTPRAAMRLLGLLRDFASMGLTLTLTGGPCHPLMSLLNQQWVEMRLRDWWMLRIVDLEQAIARRGYSRSVSVAVPLELEDELLPANAGRWMLRVQNGRGDVTRDALSTPCVRASARGIAAMYSGFMSPGQCELLGLCDGPDALLAALGAAFAGTAPWMSDHF